MRGVGLNRIVSRFSEEEVQSSPRTEAESVVETFRLRLAQRHVDTFFDFSQLTFRKWMRSEFGNGPIKFVIGEHRKISVAENRGSSSSAMPACAR